MGGPHTAQSTHSADSGGGRSWADPTERRAHTAHTAGEGGHGRTPHSAGRTQRTQRTQRDNRQHPMAPLVLSRLYNPVLNEAQILAAPSKLFPNTRFTVSW